MFESSEDFVRIRAEVKDLTEINELVLAGDKVVITTPYPYSVYNGIYAIEDITYVSKSNLTSMIITCIRPNIDLSWSDNIKKEEVQIVLKRLPEKWVLYFYNKWLKKKQLNFSYQF